MVPFRLLHQSSPSDPCKDLVFDMLWNTKAYVHGTTSPHIIAIIRIRRTMIHPAKTTLRMLRARRRTRKSDVDSMDQENVNTLHIKRRLTRLDEPTVRSRCRYRIPLY